MVVKSNFTGRRIPKLSTAKSSPVTTNFAGGVYTYKPNDTMKPEEVRLAQDARFDRVGEYGTRLGYKKMTTPIGYDWFANHNTGASSFIALQDVVDYEYTVPNNATPFALYGAYFTLKLTTDNYTVARVKAYINDELAAITCINLAANTTTSKEVIFNEAPEVGPGDIIKISVDVQTGNADEVQGQVITADSKLSISLIKCNLGGITNIFEANIDGDKTIFYACNGVLYWAHLNQYGFYEYNTIRNLPAGVEKVRFCQNLNTVRYTDGQEAPHLLTPTISGGVVTAWADSAIPVKDLKTDTTLSVTMSNIMNGVADNLIYFATDPDTEALWTYPYGYTYAKSPSYSTTDTIQGDVGDTLTIDSSTVSPSDPAISIGDWITGQGTSTAEVTAIAGTTISLTIVDTTPQTISTYDAFCTDFYQNLPAIKTGDPLTAMFNLGGVLYFMTRRNKYMMYMQSADEWNQSNANAQNGTFSQESIVCDLNYAYFASDNGVYIFDGSSEASLTENSIQNVYDAIPDKEKIVVDLYNNRLYVYYPSQAGGPNDHCLVYNINLHVWESFDSNTYVSATSARQNVSNRFICGHSRVGMLMLNEDATNNDYSDMGAPIAFNLETSYQHFGTPSQLKRIPKWRPQFATTDRPYTIECGYSLDYTDQVKYAFSIDLQRQVIVNTNYVWDNPSDYGVPAIPTRHTTIPRVNGEFYRCQIRYQHIAAFEPVIFRSHTLNVETQRIR